jgi:hypothetical protein
VLRTETKFHWTALEITLETCSALPEWLFLKYENSYRQDVSSRSASRRIPRCLCNLTYCRIVPAHAISPCVFEIRLNVILSSIPRFLSGGACPLCF